jgi:hypothetical protein
MIAKLIPSRIHGVLDYLFGILYIALPLLLNWPAPASTILMVLGAGVLLYSVLTRYELGLLKLLPMPVHLALDLLGGLLLIAAPLFGWVDESVRPWFWVLGGIELLITLLTDTRPRPAGEDPYNSRISMTGEHTNLAEGDYPNRPRAGAEGSTYTGSATTATAAHQTLPDDASWSEANRSESVGAMGETTATREDSTRVERSRADVNR